VCGPSRDYEVLAATRASSDTRPTQSIDGKTTTESRRRKQHAWQVTGNGKAGQINYINGDKQFRRTFLEKRTLGPADQCSYCAQHEIFFRHVLLSRRFCGGRTCAGARESHTIESPPNILDYWNRVYGWLDEHVDVLRDAEGSLEARYAGMVPRKHVDDGVTVGIVTPRWVMLPTGNS
jgi:hypothetical protein